MECTKKYKENAQGGSERRGENKKKYIKKHWRKAMMHEIIKSETLENIAGKWKREREGRKWGKKEGTKET